MKVQASPSGLTRLRHIARNLPYSENQLRQLARSRGAALEEIVNRLYDSLIDQRNLSKFKNFRNDIAGVERFRFVYDDVCSKVSRLPLRCGRRVQLVQLP